MFTTHADYPHPLSPETTTLPVYYNNHRFAEVLLPLQTAQLLTPLLPPTQNLTVSTISKPSRTRVRLLLGPKRTQVLLHTLVALHTLTPTQQLREALLEVLQGRTTKWAQLLSLITKVKLRSGDPFDLRVENLHYLTVPGAASLFQSQQGPPTPLPKQVAPTPRLNPLPTPQDRPTNSSIFEAENLPSIFK